MGRRGFAVRLYEPLQKRNHLPSISSNSGKHDCGLQYSAWPTPALCNWLWASYLTCHAIGSFTVCSKPSRYGRAVAHIYRGLAMCILVSWSVTSKAGDPINFSHGYEPSAAQQDSPNLIVPDQSVQTAAAQIERRTCVIYFVKARFWFRLQLFLVMHAAIHVSSMDPI